MFLKQEKPEMNDFEENKNFGSKGKTFLKCPRKTDTLAKMSQNIFAYPFVSEHSEHFLYIMRKKKNLASAKECNFFLTCSFNSSAHK